MKWFLLSAILLIMISCDNEININMDNEGLPVVYCILDVDQTVQYVRLAKSFFPEEGYWKEDHLTIDRWDEPVDIYIEEWKTTDGPVIYPFKPTTSVVQDTGYFSAPSFDLYESAFKPDTNTLYYLYLWFPEQKRYAYASTLTVGHPDIIDPMPIPGRTITFSDLDDYIVQFKTPVNSGYHPFSFTFNIEEWLAEGFRTDHFDYGGNVFELIGNQVVVYLMNSDNFYRNLMERYDTLTGGQYRRIASLEFRIRSFGKEVAIYNNLFNNGFQPWEIQTYSSFRNGFGLFSSVAQVRVTNLELSDLTYQTLIQDPRYKHMKFVR